MEEDEKKIQLDILIRKVSNFVWDKGLDLCKWLKVIYFSKEKDNLLRYNAVYDYYQEIQPQIKMIFKKSIIHEFIEI